MPLSLDVEMLSALLAFCGRDYQLPWCLFDDNLNKILNKQPNWRLIETPTAMFPGCPDDWTLHGDRCYKSSENVATGDQAKLECEVMGAVLASVHDEETVSFIRDLLDG